MSGICAARQQFDLDCMGEMFDAVVFDFPPIPAPTPEGGVVDVRHR